jgi:CheY-like chemotaxis protein
MSVRPLVLAVDDDPVQRALLLTVLQRAGFDVALA